MLAVPTSTVNIEQFTEQSEDSLSKERIWQNVSAVCDLFDMARDIKILELRRRFPLATNEWIISEALSLIERGSQ